ncbi:hypothetical protein IT157_02165, partial [bacterium]|nr:hypothetical protein [bacterium]
MKHALLILLLVFASLALAQPESQWRRGYGGGGPEICNVVLPIEDGSFLFAGSTITYGQGNDDFYVVRTDADGDTLWTRAFGGIETAVCFGAISTDDGGFLLLGQVSAGWNDNFGNFWVIKTNANGDSLWSRAFGGANGEACVAAKQTPDGGYILAGYTGSFGAGSSDFWLIKTDANGDSLWSRTLGTDLYEWCSSVLLASDGGYLLAGTGSEWSDVFDNDFLLYKTDSDGILEWSRIYQGENQDYCKAMQPTADGGYVLAGYTHETGDAGFNMMLLKVAANGDSLWSRSLGSSRDDYCLSLETTTNRYILAGHTSHPDTLDSDFMLIAADLDGDSVWSTSFGFPGYHDEECNSVRETVDGGFILSGFYDDFGTNMWAVRTYPVPAVLVTSPNGSENWPLFSTQTVTWETDDLPGLMRIEINRSYPNGIWEILADNTPNDSSEQFYITGLASNNCRIRI